MKTKHDRRIVIRTHQSQIERSKGICNSLRRCKFSNLFPFNFLLFRYWYHNACVKNGPSQRVRFVDRQTRVLLSTCHRQSQGIYTKFLSTFDNLVLTLSFDEFFFTSNLFQLENCFSWVFFVKLRGPFPGQTNLCLNFSCHKTEQGYL